jgi:predicted aspartyl protease
MMGKSAPNTLPVLAHGRTGMKSPRVVCILLLACSSWAQDSIVLPIEPTTAGIFITVTVNGKQAHLLLDTGAARTIVDNRYATKAAEIDRVIVNEQSRVQSASIKQVELCLGTLKLAGWKSVVLDTASASSRAGVRIDGFLGLDILSRFRFFQLDARERTLTLTP